MSKCVNYLYWGSRRSDTFAGALRHLVSKRDQLVLVIQSYTRVPGLMDWSLERALRALRFDYTDVLLLGLWNKTVPPRILEAAQRLKQRGLTKHLAISTHTRSLVPSFAAGQDYDVVHFRYNAAHPGAETDIFPHLPQSDRAGLTAFTATSWGQLLGKGMLRGIAGPTRMPKGERVPTSTDCYRFVMTRPEVDVCMTGPNNDPAQMEHALEALRLGPMSADELDWMRRVGRAVSGK